MIDPPCKDDPRAPHGFLRDSSHNAGKYVCECEFWEPDHVAEDSPAITVDALAKMFQPLDGIDRDAPGYHWRRGWNDALRLAMDYAQPPRAQSTPQPPARRQGLMRCSEDAMSDRELLELAAKAAAMSGYRYCEPWRGMAQYNEHLDEFYGPTWNPLTDDGDALRLACALKINIEHAETLKRAPHGVNCWPVGRGDCAHMENDLTDYAGATRRAIVRAAAELGRSVP